MADWHLHTLQRALETRGWTVQQDPEDAFIWRLHRGPTQRHVYFGPCDEWGRDLSSLDQSYHCDQDDAPGLYFYRKGSPHWPAALRAFLDASTHDPMPGDYDIALAATTSSSLQTRRPPVRRACPPAGPRSHGLHGPH